MPAPRGNFIWYDVMTTDTKAAAKFYGDVIDWQTQEHPMADGGTYTIFSKGPVMVAGLMGAREPCFEAKRPALGAVTTIINVIGRNRRPAWKAGS